MISNGQRRALHLDDAVFRSDGEHFLHGIVGERRWSIGKAIPNDLGVHGMRMRRRRRRASRTSLREKSSFFSGSLMSTSAFFFESPSLNGSLMRLVIVERDAMLSFE